MNEEKYDDIVDKQLYCCDKSSINGTFNASKELQLLETIITSISDQ